MSSVFFKVIFSTVSGSSAAEKVSCNTLLSATPASLFSTVEDASSGAANSLVVNEISVHTTGRPVSFESTTSFVVIEYAVEASRSLYAIVTPFVPFIVTLSGVISVPSDFLSLIPLIEPASISSEKVNVIVPAVATSVSPAATVEFAIVNTSAAGYFVNLMLSN